MSHLAIELDSTDQAPHTARETIRGRFADRLPATTLYDLLTVVSELVANGVRHGDGDTVRVRVDVSRTGRVSGEVENDGDGLVVERPIDRNLETGLGLRIVTALVERWKVVADGVTTVRFELRAH